MFDAPDNVEKLVPTLADGIPDWLASAVIFLNFMRENSSLFPLPDDAEARLVNWMKAWCSFPGVPIDPATEAKMGNVARFILSALRSDQDCPDLRQHLSGEEAGLLEMLVQSACLFSGIIFKISELPASPGYEPMLQQHGIDPIWARALAHLTVRSGTRQAVEHQLRPQAVRTIKALASASAISILDLANDLFKLADESTIIDTLCCEVGLREFDLLDPLRRANGEQIDREHLARILQRLAPALQVPRGPKISAASAAHEFLLEGELPALLGRNAYTHSPTEDDFTDPLTKATRLEFGNPDFDPRSAHRRVKKRRLTSAR